MSVAPFRRLFLSVIAVFIVKKHRVGVILTPVGPQRQCWGECFCRVHDQVFSALRAFGYGCHLRALPAFP
jgi:hypothetical protein